MKKTVLKVGFIGVCVLAIIFLLLPFLETTAPVVSQLHKALPQVSSENPLTQLVKRLAPLFGHKERDARTLSAQQGPNATPFEDHSLYAAHTLQPNAAEASQPAATSQTVTLPETQAPFDYADASFQTDNGEWVLIRQTAPQNSAPGMHEINVHDNPYDRYMKQERVRRFQPASSAQEIPDSKWARFTRPFKYLFSGNDSARPVQPASVQVHRGEPGQSTLLADAKAARNGKSGFNYSSNVGSGASFGQTRLSLPNITPQQWAQLTPEEREKITERHAALEFSQLLSGDRVAEQAAEIAADAKFPNPQNEQEQQKKEDYRKLLTEQNKQQIKEELLARIQANAADKEEVDELSYMTGCKDSSLPADSSACYADESPLPPSRTPQEQLFAQQTQNTQNFFDQTQYVLPQGLPFTVVLGPTNPENLQHMTDNPATQPTGEIYQFMYKQQQCDTRPCYWVPNSDQVDPQLTDALLTVNGAALKTDPQQTYASYEAPFVQNQINKLGQDATPEQVKQAAKLAQEQLTKYRPNWVPYTEEQILQMHQDTKEALAAPETDLSSGKDPIFPFVMDPAIAPQIAELIGPASFVYNNVSIVNSTTSVEAGEQLTDSLVQNVNDAKEVFNNVTQGAISEGLRTQINQQINNQNQTGGGFTGLLNLFKKSTQK